MCGMRYGRGYVISSIVGLGGEVQGIAKCNRSRASLQSPIGGGGRTINFITFKDQNSACERDIISRILESSELLAKKILLQKEINVSYVNTTITFIHIEYS